MANKVAKVTAQASIPTVNTDITLGYEPGDVIVYTVTGDIYQCFSNTAGNANWHNISTYREKLALALSVLQAAPVTGTWYNFGGALLNNLDIGVWLIESQSTWEVEVAIGAGMDILGVQVALSTSAVAGEGDIANGYAMSVPDDAVAAKTYRGTVHLQSEALLLGGEEVYIHGRVVALDGAPAAANLQLIGNDVLSRATIVNATKSRTL